MLIDVDEVIRLYVDCLEDIYRLHSSGPRIHDGANEVIVCCRDCGQAWPCKTARMVASVR